MNTKLLEELQETSAKTHHVDNLADIEFRKAETLAELDASSSEPSPICRPQPTENQRNVYHLDEHQENWMIINSIR